MAHGRGVWVKRGGLVLALAVAAATAWGVANRAAVDAWYSARQLAAAPTPEERAKWADRLAAGPAGRPALLGFLATGDAAVRESAAAAIDRVMESAADGDANATALADALLEHLPACDATAQELLIARLPQVLKRVGPAGAARGRAAVVAGLALASPAGRVAAIRAAMHPMLKLRAELVPLLNAPEAEVRRAALFAVGPATDDDPVVGDEELFRWLHDTDAGVRRGCHDALVSRGRTETDIRLGRRLTHPDAAERLDLLLDLRTDDDVADPEPWLERLARDADPGVRAGAARVAMELAAVRRQPPPVWVARLADADPEPTVRRVAGFYRSRAGASADGVRPAAGP